MPASLSVILLLLTTSARAAGDDAPATPVVDPSPAEAPAARLASSVARYLEGDVAAARTDLQALLATGPSLPPEIRREALAYLGDILYSEQGAEASRSVFEALLREAPDYRLDPYAHPAAVCAWVEQVARDLQARAVVVVPPVLPPPPTRRFAYDVLLPGGFHALRTGKPVLGASLAVVQTASAVVSIATRAAIEDAFATQDLRLTGEQDVAQPEASATERLIWINRAAATAGWLAWGVPVAVELARWSSGSDATAAVRLAPGGVSVAGTF